MSVVIRLKVPIEMHYAVIPMGTSKVNSSPDGRPFPQNRTKPDETERLLSSNVLQNRII